MTLPPGVWAWTGLGLAAALGLAVAWWRTTLDEPDPRVRRAATGAGLLALAWTLAGPWWLEPHVDPGALVALQEGTVEVSWATWHGLRTHLGPLGTAVYGLGHPPPVGPTAAPALSAWTLALATVLSLPLGLRAAGWAGAAAFVALALLPQGIQVAASAVDQHAVALVALAVAAAWAARDWVWPRPDGTASAGWGALALICTTLLAAGWREEAAVVPAAVLLGGVLARVPSLAAQWRRVPWRGLALAALAQAGLAVVLAPWSLRLLGRGTEAWGWAVRGFGPWNGAWLVGPLWGFEEASVALTALAIVGAVAAARRSPAGALGVLAVVGLLQTYLAAAHLPLLGAGGTPSRWEVIRYGALLWPWGLVLAQHGAAWALRTWPAGRWVLVLAVVVFCRVTGGAEGVFARTPEGRPLAETDGTRLLRWSLSVGAYVAGPAPTGAGAARPTTCALVARTAGWRAGAPGWAVAVHGGGDQPVRVDLVTASGAAEAVAARAPDAPCARLVRTPDCDQVVLADDGTRVPGGACDPDPGAWEDAEAWPAAPWIHPDHGRTTRDAVLVGWRALP